MPQISMTDFVDFALRVGPPRLTKVKEIKNRDDYNPGFDFWKSLRDRIIAMHQRSEPKKALDTLLDNIDSKKRNRYAAAVKGYQKFLGRKTVSWFSPPRQIWTSGDLDVVVNPELGLVIDGKRMAIKLHFKEERLVRHRVGILLLMMDMALRQGPSALDELAILDVENGKLFSAPPVDTALVPLLVGESLSFVSMWEQV